MKIISVAIAVEVIESAAQMAKIKEKSMKRIKVHNQIGHLITSTYRGLP
jgi:hypothetical protein